MAITIHASRPNDTHTYKPFDQKTLSLIGNLAAKETAAQEIRPVTREPNLGVPKLPVGGLEKANQYRMTPAQIKKSFLSVFTGEMLGSGYASKVPTFYQSLLVASYFKAVNVTGYTWLPTGKGAPKLPKVLRKAARESLTQFRSLGAFGRFVNIRKHEDHFEVTAPLCFAQDGSHLKTLIMVLTSYQKDFISSVETGEPAEPLPGFGLAYPEGETPSQPEGDSPSGMLNLDGGPTKAEYLQKLANMRLKVGDLAQYLGGPIPINAAEHLDNYLDYLSFRAIGSTLLMLGTFKIPARDMQALTSTQYSLINPHDVCGLFETWVNACVGYIRNRVPQFILPLPRIRAITPKTGTQDYRINESGLTIDAAGRYLWIPREADSIDEYESQVQNFYRNEDGSYSSTTVDGIPKDKSKRVPPRIVYVDWVNKKLAYTNRSGDLSITLLDRCSPANPSHYARFFQKPISKVYNLFSYALEATQVVVPSAFSRIQVSGVDQFLGLFYPAIWEQYGRDKVPEKLELESMISAIYEVRDLNNPGDNGLIQRWEAFADACKELVATLERDPLLINDRYAVPTVLEIRAFAFLISRYKTLAELEALSAEDRQLREKYINQGLDPNYQVKPLPFVKDDPDSPMKLLPHQVKVENYMRDSPDFALWGVDAGGGKTPISVMNYLKEMAEGNVKRILVIVPNHLVSTHINDITDFTKGRMNIIPITGYTWNRHGADRLAQMIERSPINTVVIASTTTLAAGKDVVAYGTTSVEVYYIAEWLRQFNFTYCVIDEIHELRNETVRQRAVMRVVQGIKKIRGMSGTLVANQPQDLAPQLALFDPTIFGNQEEFKRTYAEEMTSGGKVLRWKEGFEQDINSKIKENVTFVQILRKEWAALLPNLHQTFYSCDFTPVQRNLYSQILAGAREEAMKEPAIQRLLERLEAERQKDIDQEDIEEIEARIMEQLSDALRPYISRLERFVSAPAVEKAGEGLEGEDRISPKIVKAAEICLKHLQEGIPGKVIIFTNYVWVAEAGFEYLNSVPGLQGKVLHYYAGDAENLRSKFKNNDNLKIMIGQSSSMDTGLNLQYASRIIRLDTVWTPGKYEQGNARINRLNMSNQGENRSDIFIDTIFVDNTIDVTKSCYLMAKIITAEKFKNAGNPKYDNIKTPDLFPMTMDNIFSRNNTEDMMEWIGPFREMTAVQRQEVAEYRKEHPELKLTVVPRAPNIPGSALMHRTPYDPGTLLYSEDDLGLVRYDHFIGYSEEEEGEDDDDSSDKNLSDEAKEKLRLENLKVRGLPAHSDRGDGEIHRVYAKRVQIRLYATGELVSISRLATFVITRPNTNSRDMRLLLAQKNSDMPLEVRKEDLVPPKEKLPKPSRREQEVVEVVPQVELEFVTINGMLIVQAKGLDEVREAMRQFGFETPPDIVFAKVRSWKHFQSIVSAWAGIKSDSLKLPAYKRPEPKDPFSMPKECSNELKVMWDYIRSYGVRGTDLFDITRRNDFRLFKLKTAKPNPDRRSIYPFPFIYNDSFHIGLPVKGHAGTNQAILRSKRLASPAPVWRNLDKEVIWKYLGSKAQVRSLLIDITKAGIEITNMELLAEEFKSLRVKKSKAD